MKLIERYRTWWRLQHTDCPEGKKHEWTISPLNPVYPNGKVGAPFGDLGECLRCGARTYLNEPSR